MAQVSLRKIVKHYDDVEAVRGIDLDIADKEFVVLVGPSGCGKSTTLRMIAGLEDITDGEITIDGEVVNDVPPKDRVVLEHHCHIAVFRRHVVDHLAVNPDLAASDVLEASDHAQCRRFAAAGRADQNHKLFVRDI